MDDLYTRWELADELEAAESPLCDCHREESTPISPRDGSVMNHHCECRAVIASRIVRQGLTFTLHARACGCGS